MSRRRFPRQRCIPNPRLGDDGALTAYALAELGRIGWPTPAGVKVLSVRLGVPGGLRRLTLAVAQEGPLVIGRTAHMAGGLFAATK